MGLLVAFAAGWAVGAKARGQDYGDVLRSVQAVRTSDEFRELVTAVRSHIGETLRQLADTVDRTGTAGVTTDDLVERVRHLMARE